MVPGAENRAAKPLRGGNRGRSLQAQLPDALFAHDELLDFAGDRGGKGLDELDVAWDFVMGDIIATIVAQLFRACIINLAQS